MTAYWLARVTVTDPARFQPYADRAPDIVKRYGGRFLAGGSRSKVLEGSPDFERFFVIAFSSMEQAEACYNCAEYQAASKFRQGAGRVEIVIVEGAAADEIR